MEGRNPTRPETFGLPGKMPAADSVAAAVVGGHRPDRANQTEQLSVSFLCYVVDLRSLRKKMKTDRVIFSAKKSPESSSLKLLNNPFCDKLLCVWY